MALNEKAEPALDDACASARAAGNTAYVAGDMATAADSYTEALAACERAMRAEPQPKGLEVGQLVRYSEKGYFGTVMSSFPLFDEYFLKDLGSNQAIWVGDAGGNLKRFARKELLSVKREVVDFRLAVLQNLAAVDLRTGELQQCVRWTDEALCIQGRAPKALMRKGSALLKLNQPGPASDVLATALEEVPSDVEVRRLLREAEKMRSPMWVCVTGCCGPWGIVCGGPISDTNASVVAPATKKSIEEDESIAEEVFAALDEVQVAVTEPLTSGGSARVEPELAPPAPSAPSAPSAAKSTQEAPVDNAPVRRRQDPEPRSREEESCKARRAPAAVEETEEVDTELQATSMDKGVAGLLWVAAGSMMVAVVAGMWMLTMPSGQLV